jgi:hypothetical protein
MVLETEKPIANAAISVFDLKNPQPGMDLLIEAYHKFLPQEPVSKKALTF